MSSADTENSNMQTLEHLLGVVVENRERRCAEVRESARSHASGIIKQARARVRGRMHRHILSLREKYRERISAAHARNQTLIRQQRQNTDMEILDAAWPILREALRALWDDPASRYKWLDAAIKSASSILLKGNWCIEHPIDFKDDEQKYLKNNITNMDNKSAELIARADIEAGIRIVVDGTVIDATLEGLLQQRTAIEAMLISRIKQDILHHG